MVTGVKTKKSKAKNFQSNDPAYPRDIWEFVAKSTERVSNTRTGALLKDVLDYQALNPQTAAQMQREYQFPKVVFPKIDPERLKPRAVSVDPDVVQALKVQQKRHSFLDGALAGNSKNRKHSVLGQMKGHFDAAGMEQMIAHYKKTRPAWLQPKTKVVSHEEKKKEFDPSRGISKAEQEEMLTAAVFSDAKTKSERAKELRNAFHHNIKEGQLKKVQTDLALNRVFFEPEMAKRTDLNAYFAKKMVDPNLDIRVIESASPTQFFEMVHRQLNPAHYRPDSYENIVQNLTPEPDAPVLDSFDKSPYLTYVTPSGVKHHHVRPGDEDRWGRKTITDVFRLAEQYPCIPYVPKGLGHSVSLNPGRRSQAGDSPGPMAAQKAPASPSPQPALRKIESSTFITQKSGPI